MKHYTAYVRRYPNAYAGCTKPDGAKRMTDICRHAHSTKAEAEICANRLAALRNAAQEGKR